MAWTPSVRRYDPVCLSNPLRVDPPVSTERTADEVLVRVLTAGIAGVDNMQRVGGYPDPRCSKPGFTPGYEFVGEIVRLGPSVTSQDSFAVGDRVASMCTLGAHATHVVISSAELIRIDN